MHTHNRKNGFTLIEMIVSIGLFTVVLFIATSAFLSVVNVDRKSRSVRVATDNLNLALEDMSRRIKTGSSYECGASTFPALLAVSDCNPGLNSIAFTDQYGGRATYRLNAGAGTIERKLSSDTSYTTMTSPEITVTDLIFTVQGSSNSDTIQPSVLILVKGTLSGGPQAPATAFGIQTLVTQRAYDIP